VDAHDDRSLIIVGYTPLGTSSTVSSATIGRVESYLNQKLDHFCDIVDDSIVDITALSRDTAATCLDRIEVRNSPNINRLKSVSSLISSGSTLSDRIEKDSLAEVLKMGINQISRLVSGYSLGRYRSLLNDFASLKSSLETLGELKNSPSELFTAYGTKEYSVTIQGIPSIITVHSKAYLQARPFDVLEALVGREYVDIIIDILSLYYPSTPLGAILVSVLQLRNIATLVNERLFYNLPLFFVHSYTIESQLTQADMDYTGMSSFDGKPVVYRYYIRDVSRHLPVVRFSNLLPIVDERTVFHSVLSLVRRLVALLVQ